MRHKVISMCPDAFLHVWIWAIVSRDNSISTLSMTQTLRIIVGVLLIVLSGLVLLPTGIGVLRDSKKIVSIALWNTLGLLLFGLGWMIALVLSLSGSDQPTQVVVNNYAGEAPKSS